MGKMIKWFSLVLYLIANFPGIAAEGQQWYAEGKFREALDAFTELEKQGLKGGELYYNIGMCHYKLSEPAPAILYFEKALKWDPQRKRYREMLQAAQKLAGIDSFVLPNNVFSGNYFGILFFFQSIWWMMLSLLLVSTALYLKYFGVKHGNTGKSHIFYRSLMLLALACSLLTIHREYLMQSQNSFILMNPGSLKKSPDHNSPELLKLLPGLKLRKIMQLGDWVKVQTPEFDSGWVPTDQLAVIKP